MAQLLRNGRILLAELVASAVGSPLGVSKLGCSPVVCGRWQDVTRLISSPLVTVWTPAPRFVAQWTLQVAHPAVSAGVEQPSAHRSDPWRRWRHTERRVMSTDDERGSEAGRALRRFHRGERPGPAWPAVPCRSPWATTFPR
ncbi:MULTISPECIES: oxygenase MpaB family protein [unclassified Streptomyces]|uniref:oxygenase MpaB family protein n=1 Tax=unclassified Streptomyces TaxID=2593676 RepID=UPI00352C8022